MNEFYAILKLIGWGVLGIAMVLLELWDLGVFE